METIDFLMASLRIFLLIWVRVLGLFLLAPVLSSNIIVMRMRLFLAFFVALVVAPGVVEYMQNAVSVQSTGLYMALLLKELMLGCTMGFFLALILASFSLSAQFFSAQIGLSVAEIFDTSTGEQSSLMSFFFGMIALLIFFSFDGLHILLSVLSDSYRVLPVIDFFALENIKSVLDQVVKYFSYMFMIAIKISLPIVVTSVVLIVAMGVVGRAVPQANILLIGLPIQLSLGLIFIFFSLPFMVQFFTFVFQGVLKDLLFVVFHFSPQDLKT